MEMPTDRAAASPAYAAAPVVRWLCLAVAAFIVFELFYAGARPLAAGLIVEPWDKLAHFTVYAGIAALLWAGAPARTAFAIAAVVIAIGALDELHQAGLPGRSADALDFLADTCAVAITLGSLTLWSRFREPRAASAQSRRNSCAA
jgi:VanZ family protein